MRRDSSDSLSGSKLDYGVDGYMFEHPRSDDDTAGHVSGAVDYSDSEDGIVDTGSSLRLDGFL